MIKSAVRGFGGRSPPTSEELGTKFHACFMKWWDSSLGDFLRKGRFVYD